MLLLDNQVQLSESDCIYTTSLMSDEDYSGADILILGNNYKKNNFFSEKFLLSGGGDGALLAQLLTK